jgi:hypothetical protein
MEFLEHDFEGQKKIVHEYWEDLKVVMSSTSFLDTVINRLIKQTALHKNSSELNLLVAKPHLSIKRKITALNDFDVIDDDTCHDLKIIFDVRNPFGHVPFHRLDKKAFDALDKLKAITPKIGMKKDRYAFFLAVSFYEMKLLERSLVEASKNELRNKTLSKKKQRYYLKIIKELSTP